MRGIWRGAARWEGSCAEVWGAWRERLCVGVGGFPQRGIWRTRTQAAGCSPFRNRAMRRLRLASGCGASLVCRESGVLAGHRSCRNSLSLGRRARPAPSSAWLGRRPTLSAISSKKDAPWRRIAVVGDQLCARDDRLLESIAPVRDDQTRVFASREQDYRSTAYGRCGGARSRSSAV